MICNSETLVSLMAPAGYSCEYRPAQPVVTRACGRWSVLNGLPSLPHLETQDTESLIILMLKRYLSISQLFTAHNTHSICYLVV